MDENKWVLRKYAKTYLCEKCQWWSSNRTLVNFFCKKTMTFFTEKSHLSLL